MINLRRRVMAGGSDKPYDEAVMYLESTGTQYIDLGIKPFSKSSGTVQYDLLVYVNGSDQTEYACVLNTMQEISPYPGLVLRYQNNYLYTTGTPYGDTRVGAVGGVQQIIFTVNRSSSSVNNVSATMFAGYDGSGNPWRYCKMKLYECKIYDNGELVRELFPVVKNNVGYLYDNVSGQLFGNLGTGNFLYGNTVEYWWSGWYWQTLMPGQYKLECWGAQGGSYSNDYVGGKGGYSTGVITLKSPTLIQAQVGGQGTGGTSSGSKSGGHNGGGNAYSNSTNYVSCGGGGASDIRIETDSLYARVIVAGGGGGAGSYTYTRNFSGGYGGGTSGGDGYQYSISYKAGIGGTQTAGGTSYHQTTENSTTYGNLAAFGTGGGAKGTTYIIAGGGGGWYGGGYAYRASAGGGSGYVYTSSTASNYPSGCLLNSLYYLSETYMQGDDHTGDGYVRITKIS